LARAFSFGHYLFAVAASGKRNWHARAQLLPDAPVSPLLLGANNAAGVVAQVHRQCVQHGRLVDPQHHIRPALKIQAHTMVGAAPSRRKLRREESRNRLTTADSARRTSMRGECEAQSRTIFQAGETQHCLPYYKTLGFGCGRARGISAVSSWGPEVPSRFALVEPGDGRAQHSARTLSRFRYRTRVVDDFRHLPINPLAVTTVSAPMFL